MVVVVEVAVAVDEGAGAGGRWPSNRAVVAQEKA